jgi:hypothetical protein
MLLHKVAAAAVEPVARQAVRSLRADYHSGALTDQVDDSWLGRVPAVETRASCPTAEVDLLEVQKIGFIQ